MQWQPASDVKNWRCAGPKGSRVSVGNDPAVELTGIEPETLGSLGEDEEARLFSGVKLKS